MISKVKEMWELKDEELYNILSTMYFVYYKEVENRNKEKEAELFRKLNNLLSYVTSRDSNTLVAYPDPNSEDFTCVIIELDRKDDGKLFIFEDFTENSIERPCHCICREMGLGR